MVEFLYRLRLIFRSWFRRVRGEVRGRVPLAKDLCPFCFDYFRVAEAPFRCVNSTGCKKEIDPVLQKSWNIGTVQGKISAASGYSRSHKCSECQYPTSKKICPHCHLELPHTLGDYESFVISIVGAKSSGKSHYFPTLIEFLRNTAGPDLGFTIQAVGDDTMERYNEDYRKPLLEQKQTLDPTRSGLSDTRSKLPLVFHLKFYKRFDDQRRVNTKVLTLAFFDTAGEDLNSQDTMSFVNKYIYRSNGIILLLDPLQLVPVRDQLGNGAALPDRHAETSDIISRLDTLIHSGTNLSVDKHIGIPIAVALSKFDAVEGLVDPQLHVRQNSSHMGKFDLGDFRTVDGEVQALIDQWGAGYVLEQVKSAFKTSGFFAFTALGSAPQGIKINSIKPRRVADAFIWLLHLNGLVSGN